MLNLSDKELDRLSREAANQHDPGDLIGPRSWDRLEFRLDKELGRLSPSPLRGVRGIRRIPFYYAPAILLLIGASWYFIKNGKGNAAKREPSGSPPMTVVKPLSPTPNEPNTSTQTLENSQNSTSKPDKALSAEYPAPTPEAATTPNTGATTPGSGSSVSSNTGTTSGLTPPGESTITHRPPVVHPTRQLPESGSGTIGSPNGSAASRPGATGPSDELATSSNGTKASSSHTPHHRTGSLTHGATTSSHAANSTAGANSISNGANNTSQGAATSSHGVNGTSQEAATSSHGANSTSGAKSLSGANSPSGANSRSHKPTGRNQNKNNKPGLPADENENDDIATTSPTNTAAATPTYTANNPGNAKPGNSQPSEGTITPREALSSPIQTPRSLTRSAEIDDASLKAFAIAGKPVATPIKLGKKENASLHILRPLTFGFSVSPDFASVHSVAGDKPGRSIGLTMDYQVLNGFYISTGLLFTRKNYTASPGNFHAPRDSYRTFTANKIDLIKGSFDMLEIPLNLRYDFRANSNTVFFVSGGASSYLLTSEHSQYYFDYFGRPACLNFDNRLEPKNKNYLFSSVNLSMGVETGISNSLSLLVAPYVKIPTRGMGLGQVQITSVGLNFALRYSPVLSRKRK